ncbi:HsdR family type I site-specific deoxyribonuclease [Candidatus Haloredivivus sp. G17]|nr:HsdR family type I site-specific deoxyribonuclease [Candidatus Haloredivivus sp. G17]
MADHLDPSRSLSQVSLTRISFLDLGLFRFNQFSVVTSKDEARMGTYNTPQGEFKPWKDAYPTSDLELKDFFDTDKLNAQHTMFYSLFKPDRLLELVQSFTVYETKRQNTIKMVATSPKPSLTVLKP